MRRQPNKNVYKSVVAVWLTLSIGSVAVATITWVQLSAKLAAARHAFDSGVSADQVLKLVLDCETGERGFVITGDEAFLEPMLAGQTNLTTELDHLVGLVRDEPLVLQRVGAVRDEIVVLLDRFNSVNHTRKVQGFATAQAIIATGMTRSEEHTSELQSLRHLVCRLLLEKT